MGSESGHGDPQRVFDKLTALGFDHVEIEVAPRWACAMAWKSFARSDGFAAGGESLDQALANLLTQAEKEVARAIART